MLYTYVKSHLFPCLVVCSAAYRKPNVFILDINECLQKPCQNGGTCFNTDGSFTCTCNSGWTGPTCAMDVNECNELQCANGGTCINTPGSYTCICDIGWTGELCGIGLFVLFFTLGNIFSCFDRNHSRMRLILFVTFFRRGIRHM